MYKYYFITRHTTVGTYVYSQSEMILERGVADVCCASDQRDVYGGFMAVATVVQYISSFRNVLVRLHPCGF